MTLTEITITSTARNDSVKCDTILKGLKNSELRCSNSLKDNISNS